jgi:hypothetical protein
MGANAIVAISLAFARCSLTLLAARLVTCCVLSCRRLHNFLHGAAESAPAKPMYAGTARVQHMMSRFSLRVIRGLEFFENDTHPRGDGFDGFVLDESAPTVRNNISLCPNSRKESLSSGREIWALRSSVASSKPE